MTNRYKIIVPFLLLLSTSVFAKESRFHWQPIVGLERVQKIEPAGETKDRFIYGLRMNYGMPILSAEFEITQGKDTENFADRDLTIKESTTSLMLGLRSSYQLANSLYFYLRGGAHGRRNERERIENNISTKTTPAVYLNPYAGTGLTISVMEMLSINAGVTVIFTGQPRGSEQEYQTSLGFTLKVF